MMASYRGTPIRTVRIPDNIWQQVTDRAEDEGRTAGDVVRDALEAHLSHVERRH